MRRWISLSAVLTFGAALLAACSGSSGTTTTLVPSTSFVTPQSAAAGATDASTRTTDSTGGGPAVIYLSYFDRIDVFTKNATGSVLPIRRITGTNIGTVAVDRFGFLYVGDRGSWTVRKYGRYANGAATPIATYTAMYPNDEGAGWTHGVGQIALRYDGTIAAFVGSDYAATRVSRLHFGVFGPNPGTFGIAGTFPDGASARAITVDGSGDVIVGYDVINSAYAPNDQRLVRRFSPHPDGFYDDGIIISTAAGGSLACCEALAASGDDLLLESNALYAGSAGALVRRFFMNAIVPIRAPNAAFDAEGRLFFESAGMSYSHPFVQVFARHLTTGNEAPVRTFTPVIPVGGEAMPFSMAVTR